MASVDAEAFDFRVDLSSGSEAICIIQGVLLGPDVFFEFCQTLAVYVFRLDPVFRSSPCFVAAVLGIYWRKKCMKLK